MDAEKYKAILSENFFQSAQAGAKVYISTRQRPEAHRQENTVVASGKLCEQRPENGRSPILPAQPG